MMKLTAVFRWNRLLATASILCGGMVAAELRPGIVVGESMSPTLHSGQWFLLEQGAYRDALPRKDEVVVFRHRGRTYIKRVLGGPGDTVWLLKRRDWDGVYSTPIPHDLMRQARRLSRSKSFGQIQWDLVGKRVPTGHIYVIGDMLTRSEDSRHLGPIPVHEIQGRVRLPFGSTVFAAAFDGRPIPKSRTTIINRPVNQK